LYEVLQTQVFSRWLLRLRDNKAKARIVARLEAVKCGNLGDSAPVGPGVSEFRIDTGPGYRVYFVRRKLVIIVLLCGGDKSTQRRDIARAQAMAKDLDLE
jgi:putative addiction module killer protein